MLWACPPAFQIHGVATSARTVLPVPCYVPPKRPTVCQRIEALERGLRRRRAEVAELRRGAAA